MTSLKHRLMYTVAATFATVAFVLSILANLWCETIQFTPSFANSTSASVQQAAKTATLHLGVFYYRSYVVIQNLGGQYIITDVCVTYPDSVSYDPKWKATKAFAIMTPVIGGFCLFWVWWAVCFGMTDSARKLGGMAFLLCCLFQGLTLLLLASDACLTNPLITLGAQDSVFNTLLYPNDCEFDKGTKMNISSVVMWFVAGLVTCVLPSAEAEDSLLPPPEQQTVTYQKEVNPDGTTTVKEVDVVKEEAA